MCTKTPSPVLVRGLFVALTFMVAFMAGAGCAAPAGVSEGAGTPATEQPEESLPRVPERQETNMSAYECADSFRFSTMMKRDTVQLFLPSQRLALPREWAMDGAKYRRGPTLFWKKGQRNARLRVDGTEYPDCRRTPQRDVWVAARRRGVDLRAVGTKPVGWHLDLKDETYIIFTTDPDEERVVAPAPVPDTAQGLEVGSTEASPPAESPPAESPPSRLVYEVETEKHMLTLTVTEAPCRDPVSGKRYAKRVAVALKGQRYEGCGRRLR